MTVTSGSITLSKDDSNLIGISIGGGAPMCPCLYIVQVFDNTPAAKDATLEAGDELVGVNGANVKVGRDEYVGFKVTASRARLKWRWPR